MTLPKHQKIINFVLKANGATAAAVLLGSVFICAGTTIAWFTSAPFVSDRTEVQIHRPILPSAAGIVVGLGWASAAAWAATKWHKREETEAQRRDRFAAEAQRQRIEEQQQAELHRAYQEALPALEQWNAELQDQQEAGRPIACRGCLHYHGHSYNGTRLICGMYPHGWSDEKCPEWSASPTQDNQE